MRITKSRGLYPRLFLHFVSYIYEKWCIFANFCSLERKTETFANPLYKRDCENCLHFSQLLVWQRTVILIETR